jgi:thiamine-monophosphate kinase
MMSGLLRRSHSECEPMGVNDGRISDETELIQTYLAPLAAPGAFNLSDDAALIETIDGVDFVATNDPVIAGVHFFADDDPRDIAWKALAVNISDLVAKGADPHSYTMALAFPDAPERRWMEAFSRGLAEAQAAFGCRLMGGDTDRTLGPLSISITALGSLPRGAFVRRQTARIGDHVFVSGTIGDSALGLALRHGGRDVIENLSTSEQAFLRDRYLRPRPRIGLVPILRRYATAALDVSDGLLKDARRLADGAGGGLAIHQAAVPLSAAAKAAVLAEPTFLGLLATGGDDYEVMFSAAPSDCQNVIAACASADVRVTDIGIIQPGTGVSLVTRDGAIMRPSKTGYDHFGG